MDLEKPITQEDMDNLVAAWLAYYQERTQSRNSSWEPNPHSPHYWAIEMLDDICRTQPEQCWKLISQLLDGATLNSQIESLAKGPLQDLLAQHGRDFIDRVEAEAQNNSRFKNLLREVFRYPFDAEFWERIQRINLDDLVAAWLAYHQEWKELRDSSNESGQYGPHWWAASWMLDMPADQPELCWKLILQILDGATTDCQIANLAAGPMEDLLAQHGRDFIDRVEAEAKINGRFKHLLGGVWQNDMDDALWERVQRFC